MLNIDVYVIVAYIYVCILYMFAHLYRFLILYFVKQACEVLN